MSKRVDERKPSELQVLNLADKLAKYILEMCVNKEYFPTKYRYTLTRKLSEAAMDMLIYIKSANDIHVQTYKDYEIRRGFQNRADAEIEKLLTLTNLAHSIFKNVSGHKVYTISNMADNTRLKLYAWMKSDKRINKDIISMEAIKK